MATVLFIGNADAVAQVTHVVPDNVEIGDVFTLKINNKTVSFTATAATVANVVSGLVDAVNASTIPEFQEVVATEGTDENGDTTHVVLTSREAGVPFTVTGTTTNAGSFSIQVETLQEGGAGTNEIKSFQLAGVPTGGTFTLTFGGQTTSAQPYNESAANVETDLEALSSIGAGQVAVTRSGSGVSGDPFIWTIEFQGTLANRNVGALTGSGASLTGAGEITHETIQEGGSTSNEVQTLTHAITDSGTYYVYFSPTAGSPDLVGEFTAGMSGAAFNTLLQSYFGVGGATATRETSGSDYVYTIRWLSSGAYAAQDLEELTVEDSVTGTTAVTPATLVDGGGAAVNEIQHVHILHGPTGGTFTLDYDGQTTAGIAYNASAATVVSALEALSNIGVGEVAITKTGSGTEADPTVFEIEFQAALAATDVSELTSDASGLTGAEVVVTTDTQGSTGTNEQQRFTITGGTPAGGTFTITQDYGSGDETTGNIAYNASAATFRAALEALTTPVPGDLVVTGAAGGPWTVEYQGAFAAADVNEATGDGANLTGTGDQTLTVTTETAATGPNFADNVLNYSGGALPVNSDTLIFERCDVDLLYNLTALSAVALTNLYIHQSYTGKIGLPVRSGPVGTGYYEYRATYFAIQASNVYIGQGEGAGSGRIKLDLGSGTASTITIENSGFPVEADVPAIVLKGTNASNALTVNKGSVGVAIFGGETANLSGGLKIGYQTDVLSDAAVFLGSGVTLATVTKSGGTLESNSNITTLTNGDGDVTITAGAITTLAVNGGRVIYNSTGTLTTGSVSGLGILDFSQDDRTKTVTNPIDVYGTLAQVIDPKKSVTSLIVDYNQTTAGNLQLGSNVRFTRGTPA